MLVLACVAAAAPLLSAQDGGAANDKAKFPLPLPSEIGSKSSRRNSTISLLPTATKAGKHDAEVRATGPYIVTANGSVESFGTHGPGGVKVWYSPGVWAWMNNGMKGVIADGEMVMKEIYPRDENNAENFQAEPTAFSVMVKDSKGSWDGWYWSDGGPLLKPNANHAQKFFDLNAGFCAGDAASTATHRCRTKRARSQACATFTVRRFRSPQSCPR